MRHAAGALIECGIRELVVIHFPEGAFARTLDGRDFWQSSLKLPQKYIAGSAGAGDAFCAGVLMGLHQGWDIQQCLKAGVCAAASSLSHPTCTGGIQSLQDCLELPKREILPTTFKKPLPLKQAYPSRLLSSLRLVKKSRWIPAPVNTWNVPDRAFLAGNLYVRKLFELSELPSSRLVV